MTFVKAETVRYENRFDPQTNEMTGIFIAGLIYEDSWVETNLDGSPATDSSGTVILKPRYSECWIEGSELAALPPEDPALAPFDARGLQIRTIAVREAKRAWQRFHEMASTAPILTAKTPQELAVLPPMSPEELGALG